MARACQDWFPKGTYKRQKDDGFFMDDRLKTQLDILLKNLPNDWDFTIIITGSGEVRVGKSLLAMQIGAYVSYVMNKDYGANTIFNLDNNVCFEGINLIKKGHFLGANHKYSPLVYDEAGADIDSKKILQRGTQIVLDYYRECGQYNLINILVLPDFFDLPKGLAITRSVCLIDVIYYPDKKDIFQRGFMKFYSRRNKKDLYLKGKKMLDYFAAKHNFDCRFIHFWTINEEEYRKRKLLALKKRDSIYRDKALLQRNAAFYLLNHEFNQTQEEIARRIEQITSIYTPRSTVSDAIAGIIIREKPLE